MASGSWEDHAGQGTQEHTGEPELRLVLVGKTGAGKSATGNTILGRAAFELRLEPQAMTWMCARESRLWQGCRVVVTDTPSMFDSPEHSAWSCYELARCLLLSAPGPHVLVLVTQVGRFTQEDEEAARQVWRVLGREAVRHTVVLFTHKEELGDSSLQRYVARNAALWALLQICGGRCCAFSNRAARAKREAQVEELMVLVQQVLEENRSTHYTSELYSQATQLLSRSDVDFEEKCECLAKQVEQQLQGQQGDGSWGCSDGAAAVSQGIEATCAGSRGSTSPSQAVAVHHAYMQPGVGGGLEMRLILAGKAGEGKSTTGNTLLGKRVFESKLSTQPVTVSCASAQGHWDGEDFTVVDTADIFNPRGASSEVRQEIIRCIRLSSPGPHALLLVTQLGRFTQEDKEVTERLQDIFGADILGHTIIIFTRAEELGERSLHDYVSCTHNKALRKLIERCGNRYCGFNNRAVGAERDQQVAKLMGMVRCMVQANGDRYYSNEMYLEPNLTEEKVEYHMARYSLGRMTREWFS